jgi:two-component system, LuxR family, response regulator FixJ
MATLTSLFLIDGDVRRRAAVCHALVGAGIYVDPFENAAELATRWPRDGVILVEDGGSHLAELIDHMAQEDCWLPIVCFSEAPTAKRVAQAVLDGAVGYLDWPFEAPDVLAAVTAAKETAQNFGSFKLRQARARSRVQKLTPREREVLSGITDGLSNREIGERLAISPRTVEIHRSNMLHKVGANHTSQAIRIAIEASLVA